MMKLPVIGLQRVSEYAQIPVLGTIDSACYDIFAAETCRVVSNGTRVVFTGWKLEIPQGWFLDIRPRSGMASIGITVGNAPGVVDSDYRGELKVILHNHGSSPFEVKVGDRIAQCRLERVNPCRFEERKILSKTVRGTGGMGSTGR
jgi:dUTP pyrophosphatase